MRCTGPVAWAKESVWKSGERIAEAISNGLGGADVDLRRLEVRVPGALHDLERLVPTNRHPREPRGAKVVPRELLGRPRRRVELRARNTCPGKPTPQPARHFRLAHEVGDGPLAAHAVEQLAQQREQRRLDAETSCAPRLRRRNRARPPISRSVDVDGPVFEVDRTVFPSKNTKLAVAGKEVDRKRHREASSKRNHLARSKLEKFGGVQERLAPAFPAVRPFDARARVVGTHAERVNLR